MRISGTAAAATLVTFMAIIGPQSAAKADSRNTLYLRADHGAQVSQPVFIKGDFLFYFFEWRKEVNRLSVVLKLIN